jgi:hypothetical protein
MDGFEELFSSLIKLVCSFIIADGQSNVIELLNVRRNSFVSLLLRMVA